MSDQKQERNQELAAWLMEAWRRSAVHYGLWLGETIHQVGLEPALAMEAEAGDAFTSILLRRLSKILDFEIRDGVPAPLAELPGEKLEALAEAVSINWLALDGVWFQAVERARALQDAQRANDTCWTRFSPFEAKRIMTLAEIPESGGLDALITALGLRLYARINVQEIVRESESSFVFYMRECRVQSARKRKNMTPYSCKPGGVMEYRHFAWTIDYRIQTECVACPPDETGPDYACAWRFTLEDPA